MSELQTLKSMMLREFDYACKVWAALLAYNKEAENNLSMMEVCNQFAVLCNNHWCWWTPEVPKDWHHSFRVMCLDTVQAPAVLLPLVDSSKLPPVVNEMYQLNRDANVVVCAYMLDELNGGTQSGVGGRIATKWRVGELGSLRPYFPTDEELKRVTGSKVLDLEPIRYS